MQAIRRLIAIATSRNDILLAATVMAIVFMMILPMPTAVMDVLIAANITLSCVLLMVAIYLPSALAFSSFPAVLLVSTLFRLGISISTTRLILLDGDAGHIIDTFGNFVVGGNLVVGLVVFLILTIVQFIVITKGSERVAEVAARFSLDGMPGKQMSIDADLRAGAIQMEEARRRRSVVEKESQLYGAMDGAMKFVKGDAIAGLIIVAVNLLGGLLIGSVQRGMTAGEAALTYSILSVGDGLISQIPALLTAICAGIIVTRVPTGDKPSNVGSDIGAQVMAHPRALVIAAIIALGIGLIPGMPTLVFLALATLIGVTGFVLLGNARAGGGTGTGGLPGDGGFGADGDSQPEAGQPTKFAPADPVTLELAEALAAEIDEESVKGEFPAVRYALYQELGVPLPDIKLRRGKQLRDRSYQILLFEVPIVQGALRSGSVLVREGSRNLDAMGIPYERDSAGLSQESAFWVSRDHAAALDGAGIPYLHPHQVPNWHLSIVLRRHASQFIGIQETRQLLTAMEENFGELVKEAHRVMPIQKIAEILQRLISEDISIRDMRAVLEALVEWAQKEKDIVLLTEYVRMALKRYISHKYSNGQNFLPSYLLAPDVEDLVRDAIRQTAGGSYLAMDPEKSQALLDSIRRTVGTLETMIARPVILTSMDIRRYVRKLIEQDLYQLPVLSYQELVPEINVQPLARVDL
ncbi:type III secretion system export apparatus subunit SctV [Bordetella bronchialis]|uniref:EscV/YscV/HrcV family type III secretion system export apparatus protein n=1 Tax=Bordetella bronchialis TaxID=463025 RepID=A0A193FKW1_9BORD|nr:type III secretion system export apparatus subunit SctV [Bordetella bronchialis]ANN68305.1 EscV/YscV/HrcV family type III secretion system export apparatus protein [Bordetella bronchialis]ANN73445.1 EscV/YscV/HrcV family type III secretion system export apparatus protein [Bordetella bronchialis]